MATGSVTDTDTLDETFDFFCYLCKSKHINTEASKFCVDCQDYYCSTCVKFHDDIPVLSRHKILNKRQFQHRQDTELRTVPTEQCERHSHKHVDMYCQNHDEVGCSICMAVDHKSCQDMHFIPDFIQRNPDTIKSDFIFESLESTANALANQIASFEQERNRLLRNEATCLEKANEFRDAISQRLGQLEQNTIQAIQAKYKPKLEKLDHYMKEMKKSRTAVLSAKTVLSSAGANESQNFVSAKKCTKITNNAVSYVAKTNSELKKQEISFMPYRKLSDTLKELNDLGHLTEI